MPSFEAWIVLGLLVSGVTAVIYVLAREYDG